MSLPWSVGLLKNREEDLPVTVISTPGRNFLGHFTDQTNSHCYFIDCGAHQGETIEGFVKYREYHGITSKYNLSSYEPSRQAQIWTPLSLQAAKYKYDYESIYVGNFGIAARTEIRTFYDNGSAGSSIHPDKPLESNVSKIRIPTLSLTEILANIPDSPESLIVKLNVEGAEYEILDSLFSNQFLCSKVTEFWLDFHGYQFIEKEVYKHKEIEYINFLKKLNVPAYDVNFMNGFYKGWEKYPPKKQLIQLEELLKAYK